ncbi:MAG: DnaA regulatory inactivator Hda [Acidiferrobacterales bacterium]|nr:DnaA regulatory inactivator Hda [Acidiferrobacterales bacterium]
MTQKKNLQMALPIALDDKASFANYFADSNIELVEVLKASIKQGQQAILFFYGISGCGKSHLMFAFQRFAKQSNIKSVYIALSNPQVSLQMLEMIDPKTIICIDDIDAWAGDSAKETVIFSLFERVKQGNGSLIVSAKNPPEASNFRLKDLASRLNSGLVYPVHRLDDNQCFAAIKLRAENRGLRIADEVVRYLLNRSSRDTAELFSLLDQIDKASLIEKRRITIPFLQSVLK